MGRKSDLQWILDKQIHWISAADTKLFVLIPVPLALLSVLLNAWEGDPFTLNSHTLPFWFSTVSLVAALAFALGCLVSRTKSTRISQIFFGDIVSTGHESYRELSGLKDLPTEEDLIAQICVNANIALQKHKNARRSAYALAVSLVPTLFCILVEN